MSQITGKPRVQIKIASLLLALAIAILSSGSASATTASISPTYQRVHPGQRGAFHTEWTGTTPYISVRFSDGFRGGFSYSYTAVSSRDTTALYSQAGQFYPSLDVTDINHASDSTEVLVVCD